MPTYSAEAERDAYCHPSITSQAPLLWIPRDPLGVSSQEVAHTMPRHPHHGRGLLARREVQDQLERGQGPASHLRGEDRLLSAIPPHSRLSSNDISIRVKGSALVHTYTWFGISPTRFR